MKGEFGTDLSLYDRKKLESIKAASFYQSFLFKLYIVWNVAFMVGGVIVVYTNANWLTTYEILGVLGIFWGVSGLPFFLVREQVRRRFADLLPELGRPSPLGVLFKALAGFALGSWATHVMLIASFVRCFELWGYAKKIENRLKK